MANSYQSRPKDSQVDSFDVWLYLAAAIIVIIISVVASFFIGYYRGKTVIKSQTTLQPTENIVLRSLPPNTDINTGNLNLTGQLTSISNIHTLVVQTLSGNSYTLTADSQTTTLLKNKLVALSSVKVGSIVTINAITQRDGSLTPLRIIIIK